MKVTVVGAGVGGLAVAGCAGLAGHEVRLVDVRAEAVDPIGVAGGIRVRGELGGFAPVVLATLEHAEAVREADLVILVTQGPEQGGAATDLAPHLRPGQVVLVKPGCTGGALEVREVLGALDVAVAETDAFAFGCSIPEPGVSQISSVKKRFGVAAVPAERTAEVVAVVREVFPQAAPAPSVLHTSLSNMNAILHVAPMVTNAGRIEHEGGAFDFYGDAVTPSVARLMAATDSDRIAVAEALGVRVPTLSAWILDTYGVDEPTLHEAIQRLHREVYGPSPAPTTLLHRYLLEDVPCGAVPVASLGQQLGVPVETTIRCVHLASLLVGRDLWESGRTARRLGLEGRTAAEMRALVGSS
jgi:opine dehydrogenase